jgi:cytochrome bd-type quinol oxidase subunit 2
MNDNPIIVDVLINILGIIIGMHIANSIYRRGHQRNKWFAASVGLLFASLYCYFMAKYFHMTFRLVLSEQGIRWERANVYLLWAFGAAISALYFYTAKNNKIVPLAKSPEKSSLMKALRFISGLFLILIAITFAKTVPRNWQATDPRAHARVMIAIVSTIVIGAGGSVLLYDYYKNRSK